MGFSYLVCFICALIMIGSYPLDIRALNKLHKALRYDISSEQFLALRIASPFITPLKGERIWELLYGKYKNVLVGLKYIFVSGCFMSFYLLPSKISSFKLIPRFGFSLKKSFNPDSCSSLRIMGAVATDLLNTRNPSSMYLDLKIIPVWFKVFLHLWIKYKFANGGAT